MTRSYASPFQTEVWEVVAANRGKRTASEWRSIPAVKELCCSYHEALGKALAALAEKGFLNCEKQGRGRVVFWYAADCAVPLGASLLARSGGDDDMPSIRASERTICSYLLPVDTSKTSAPPPRNEWRSFPSRRGDRLYYRDGRVTDLAGNEIGETA